MRRFLAVLSLLLLAPTLSAQTIYKTDPGVYVSLDEISYGSGAAFSFDGAVGYRFGTGLDLGVGLDVKRSDAFGFGKLGANVLAGYTLPLSQTVGLRGDARAFAMTSQLYRDDAALRSATRGSLELRETGLDLTATVFRQVPLGSRVTLYPSAGLYLDTKRFWNTESGVSSVRPLLVGGNPATSYASGGFELGLPVAVRMFEDKHLVFEPAFRYGDTAFGDGLRYQLSFGLKFNF